MNSGSDRTEYAFDPTTGRLSSVKDAFGTTYSLTYDAAGPPLVITAPAVVDSMTYFAGGRLKTRKTYVNGSLQPGPGTYSYDDARRLLLTDFEYNALGHVTQYVNNGITEVFERDPFGDPIFHDYGSTGGGQPSPGAFSTDYPASKGGRAGNSSGEWTFGGDVPTGWFGGTKTPTYDARGNLEGTTTIENAWSYSQGYVTATRTGEARSMSRNYYAADGTLMAHQINRDSLRYPLPTPPVDTVAQAPWGAYEEYWYDALGRRVLKRTRQETPICTNSSRCYSAIERYVWDGDQILWEFRQANAGDTKDPNPTPSDGQSGHVGYVHAGGIDAPLGMIRNDTTVVLHHDYRGLYYAATNTAGGSLFSTVPWPSTEWQLGHRPLEPSNTPTWVGSLPMGQMDRTGMLYRRNRYYDPVTIQFTQQDPIGIAGGLNLYGYANGDPINFSDPFGLYQENTSVPTVWLSLTYGPGFPERCPICSFRGPRIGGGPGGGGVAGPHGPPGPARDGVGGPSVGPQPHAGPSIGPSTRPVTRRRSNRASEPARTNWQCVAASGELLANLAVDAVLAYAGYTALVTVGTGLAVATEGYLISSLLLEPIAVGIPMRALGWATVSQGVAAWSSNVDWLPGHMSVLPRNSWDFIASGGLSAC